MLSEIPKPFFTSGDAGTSLRKLLLISYHFPPSSAVGSLRWQRMAGEFSKRGWALDVIALDPGELARPDADRLDELPSGTRIFGVRSDPLRIEKVELALWKAYRRLKPAPSVSSNDGPAPTDHPAHRPHPESLHKDEIAWNIGHLRGWVRSYNAWLQYAQEAAWARRAAEVALRLTESTGYGAVISCGPPHLVHEAGRLVSVRTGLPLVLDMRDPWCLQPRILEPLASPLWYRLGNRYEKRIVACASTVVMNTAPAAEAMSRMYPRCTVISVLNGVDDDPMPETPRRDRFVIAYAGTIYLDRDPRLLFRAAGRVVRDLGLPQTRFGFEFLGIAGAYGGTSVEQIAAEEGLGGYVQAGPFRLRHEAQQLLAQASVLVSLPQDSVLSIPSKIFEYLRFDAWILALADQESATERLLRGRGADVVAPHDVNGMATVLRKRYEAFARGERPSALGGDPTLSRRHQAGRFCDAIESILHSMKLPPTRHGL